MQKHLLKSLIFVLITILGFDLFAQDFEISKCFRVLIPFDLPKPLQMIEASNIRITNISQRHSTALTDYFDLYEFSFPIDERIYRLEVGIQKPKTINEANGVSNQVILERLRHIIGDLPKGAFQKKISLIIRRRNKGEEIYGVSIKGSVTWTGNVINLYPPLGLFTAERYNPIQTLKTMQHELGHIMDIKIHFYPIYFSISHSQRWKDAILADGHSVSEYGDTKLEEDFAEAMLIYMESNGGLYHPFFLDSFPHRFAILDEVMGVEPFQRSQINEESYLRLFNEF